jgi:hypothetical protein
MPYPPVFKIATNRMVGPASEGVIGIAFDTESEVIHLKLSIEDALLVSRLIRSHCESPSGIPGNDGRVSRDELLLSFANKLQNIERDLQGLSDDVARIALHEKHRQIAADALTAPSKALNPLSYAIGVLQLRPPSPQ